MSWNDRYFTKRIIEDMTGTSTVSPGGVGSNIPLPIGMKPKDVTPGKTSTPYSKKNAQEAKKTLKRIKEDNCNILQGSSEMDNANMSVPAKQSSGKEKQNIEQNKSDKNSMRKTKAFLNKNTTLTHNFGI